MIRAMMAELQLERLASEREAAKLMPQADAEYRYAPRQLANRFDGVIDRLRIARSIGQKNPVGLERQNVLGRSLGGNDLHVAVMIDQQAQDVLLDAEIVGRHAEPRRVVLIVRTAHLLRPGRSRKFDRATLPFVRLAARHAARQLLPCHGRRLFGLKDTLLGCRSVRGHDAAQSADISYVPHQGARIDIPDDGDFVPVEVELRRFRGTPTGGHRGKLTHNQRLDVRPRRFLVVQICAHVSDVGIGKTNDLSRIAGVGENFLVSGEAGIKNDFAAAAKSFLIPASPDTKKFSPTPAMRDRSFVLPIPTSETWAQIWTTRNLRGLTSRR